ncbi:EAL domain-containing protein [Thalassotalea agarivorans]|uniref:Diguanylate cyclase/phosphodiesterase n=1 Tax=Thalassotalea agarivorans TaxID=349064 RepID=A0A1H9ZY50_THASX|nr:EAL domain-containing protein [Thalassotalea agarivorans]SES85798.1 diguanylate cyclase/phosphodiesterase [Thalassotalea agarivorans]
MYTFSQLLIRNTVLGVLFSITMAVLSLTVLSSYLEQVQQDSQQTIRSLATQTLNNTEANLLSKTLQRSFTFQQLNIDIISGDKLTNYKNSKTNFLVNLVSPQPKQIIIKDHQVKISYLLDFSKQVSLVSTIILIMIAATALFLTLSAYLSTTKYKRIFDGFNRQIKQEIDHVMKPDVARGADPDIVEIPELKKGLSEIHQLIESQVENSSALEKEAYYEKLTGFYNRNAFVQFYENKINQNDEIEFGVLLITRCSELQTINQIHGYHEGDKYILAVAEIMKKSAQKYQGAELFRINSSDFATIIPNTKLQDAEEYAKDLSRQFDDFQTSSELDSVANTGLVYFDKQKPLGELLALADTGISVAQTQQVNSYHSQRDTDILKSTSANYGNQNWRQEIDGVLENERIILLVQHIKPSNRNTRAYGEILARFLNSNEEMLPTASFIAMAEKLDRIVAVDKLVIETAIAEINNKNLYDQSYGINISARTIHDEQFLVWLERRLLREPKVAPKLVFEITEYGLQQNIRTSKRFIDMLHRVGSRITVERFGVGLTSFKFFRDLKPDFIKMDATYTRDIDEDKNNQYFLRLMVDLAHRLSIYVLAESVETQEEKHTLERLFVDGCQGFYIGKPQNL